MDSLKNLGALLDLAVFEIDAQGRLLHCSAACMALLGLARAEGVAFAALFDEAGAGAIEEAMRQQKASVEAKVKGGDAPWLRLAIAKNGSQWVGSASDITFEKKQSQTELWLAHASNLAKVGVWDWDLVTGSVSWSEQMYEIYGVSKDGFSGRGQDYMNLVHPEDLPIVQASVQERLREAREGKAPQGRMPAPIFRIIRPNGQILHVRSEASIRIDSTGTPIRMIGVLQDVTPWVANEKDLRESKNFLEVALRASAMGIWSFNVKTKEVYWSKEVYQIYNVTNAVFDGSYEAYMRLLHPDDRALVIDKVAHVLGHPSEDYFVEHRILVKEDVRWLEGRGRVYLGSDGCPELLVGTVVDITERKKDEERLKNSETRLQMAIEASKLGYFDWNMETNEVFWDEHLKQMYALPKDFDGDKNAFFLSLIHPYDVARISNNLSQAIAGIRTAVDAPDDYRVTMPDGSLKYLSTWFKVFFNQEGKPTRIAGVTQDITKRMLTEIALQRSEERYASVLQAMSEGIVVQDLNSHIVASNKAAEEIIGLTLEQMSGKSSLDPSWRTIHEDGSPFAGKDHPTMITLRTGKPQKNVIMGVYKPNGSLSWISINSEPLIKEDTGELVGTVATFTDITQQCLAENEVKQLALVAQHTDNAVIIANRQGHIEWVNNSFMRITGYAMEDVVGKLPSELLYKDEHTQALEEIWHTLSHKGTVKTDMVNYTKTGRAFWAEVNIQPVLSAKGRIEKFITLISDITERKAKEEEIQRQNDELKKTNQELDNFVYRVSHDLRAPISSALGLVSLMKVSEVPQALSVYVDLQEQSLKKLDLFIKDILDYSRNARMQVAPEEVNMQALLDDIFSQLEYLDEAPHLDRQVRIEGGPFHSDRRRLLMLFNNLLSNAFRFKRPYEAHPFVKIDIRITPKEATIVVADNGIGIEEVHLTRIFDMFYRASERKTGSGLGLYIVKEAVEKLKGQIQVASVFGEGTIFTMVLPNMIR